MRKISISEVLTNLREGRKCSLEYIRATGKKAGTKKHITNAIEGWNYTSFRKRLPIDHIRAKFHKQIGLNRRRGLIPIIELDTKTQLTLHIALLVKYNGQTIVH